MPLDDLMLMTSYYDLKYEARQKQLDEMERKTNQARLQNRRRR